MGREGQKLRGNVEGSGEAKNKVTATPMKTGPGDSDGGANRNSFNNPNQQLGPLSFYRRSTLEECVLPTSWESQKILAVSNEERRTLYQRT